MAVSTATYSPITVAGDGATVAISVTWPFFNSTDLVVTAIASDGTETVQTLTTHYSVSGGKDANNLPATGTVTMVTAPASGTSVRIERSTPRTQSQGISKSGPFPAKVVEAQADRLTLMAQEIAYFQQYKFRTAWATSTAYEVNDLVTHNGALYAAIAAHTSSATDEPDIGANTDTYWARLMRPTNAGFTWLFSTSTSGDPGAGKFLVNNATLASVTSISLSDTNVDGLDVSAWLATWDDESGATRGKIIVRDLTDAGAYLILNVSAAGTDNSSYWTFAVTHVASAGTLSGHCDVTFIRNGADGADGRRGGLPFTFSTTTTMADPGQGVVRLNNGTIGSVTAIAIDDETSSAVDVSAYITAWANSTSTNKGTVIIESQNLDDATVAIFTITGLTDNSGWTELAVTYVAGTLPSDAEAIGVSFYRTGSKGDSGTGSGDLLSTENLADVENATTARLNLGAAAASHNHAASEITSGTLAHERGGLEADVSGFDGLVKISGGATSAITAPTGDIVGTSDTQTLSAKTLTAPVVNVGSDAEGDVYYRNGSGILTRLAIGTAGQALTVNSGATAPEWADAAPSVTGISAWVTFTGTTGAILDSENVGSITRNAAGNYTVNFGTAMSDTNYAVSILYGLLGAGNSFMGGYETGTRTVNGFTFFVTNNSGTGYDGALMQVIVVGGV